jgi:hypothetical protein
MQRTLLGDLAQRGLPVHQRCVVTPAGYPGHFSPFSEEAVAKQCISGYLTSVEVGRDRSSSTNLADWPHAPQACFLIDLVTLIP